jgi:RNA polymerase sigma-70 factor (ECF subfamily)
MAERPPEDPRERVGRLYDAHGASLYRYAVMLLADPAAAEDAVHQVFAALLRPSAAARIDDATHYLRRAVRNECYSLLRRHRSRAEDNGTAPLLEQIAAPEGGTADERLALERALRLLPPEQREVVHLHMFEGLTFQEIANAANESINTIASRYRYALARLRALLGSRHE